MATLARKAYRIRIKATGCQYFVGAAGPDQARRKVAAAAKVKFADTALMKQLNPREIQHFKAMQGMVIHDTSS
jgi:hypothetical protein